ncbi:phage tail protein [Metapseudomonas otitidis]|uniref:phage tail protein n=1 Tax=Metapseudomonas otitidis TaxID=319939 RepID=UPI0013F68067|nr:phage tail protein [Pseudomonas otitidis]
MKRFYSQSTGSTYLEGLHESMPPDAVEISEDRYRSVIARPAAGKVRSHDSDGLPILVDPPPPAPLPREELEALRLRAYAEPLTGSDRYFAEAQRESLLGNAEAAEAAKALGLARFAEIQAEYPWPAE